MTPVQKHLAKRQNEYLKMYAGIFSNLAVAAIVAGVGVGFTREGTIWGAFAGLMGGGILVLGAAWSLTYFKAEE